MTILTTCCYLKKDGKTLLLHRTKKQNDINEGKWIGIGGKIENGESPTQCAIREFYEETGLTIKNVELKAYITFPGIYYGQDEGMFLFKASDFEGNLTKNCLEGNLQWVDNSQIETLPMWEGDKYFDSFLSHEGFVEAKFTYKDDKLIEKIIHYY